MEVSRFRVRTLALGTESRFESGTFSLLPELFIT